MSTALSYRPEIDGLRTVAVLPVILFHAGFSIFSGGYVGVDVFFVISGYLITTILLRDLSEGRFSILRFYERRARRILPALFFVMLACLPFAWFWMFPAQLQKFGDSIAATILFSSNVLFWSESGYFDADSELKPLLHTWSLAVEEQYYIFFPPFLWLVSRYFGLRGFIWSLVVIGLLSLTLAELLATRREAFNFYMLPTRAWELLIGSLLAAWLQHRPAPTGALAEGGGVLGLAMIAGAIVLLDGKTPFPGLWALIPTVGTALVILCTTSATVAGRFLALRPMVAIGLISYSAYLWHHPLFAFSRIRSLDQPSQPLMLGLAILSLGLAYISWRFVERPFRDRSRIDAKSVLSFAGAGMAAFLIVGAGFHLARGVPARFDETTLKVLATSLELGRGRQGCISDTRLPNEGCVFHPELASRILLWGDSHAMAIAESLAQGLAKKGFGLEAILSSGCPPALGIRPDNRPRCPEESAATLRYIESATAPQQIVIAARWSLAFEGVRFDNGEGGADMAPPRILRHVSLHDKSQPDAMATAVSETIDRLLAAGKRVTIVGNVPEAGWNVPERLAKMQIRISAKESQLSTSRDVFEIRRSRSRAVLLALRDRGRIRFVEPSDSLCSTGHNARCYLEANDVALYRDNNHLSLAGAALVVPEIVKAIVADQARDTAIEMPRP